MIQQRTIHAPLHAVYRHGNLVAAFPTLEDAAAYEDTLDAADAAAVLAETEPTPIYGEAADAATVNHFLAPIHGLRPTLYGGVGYVPADAPMSSEARAKVRDLTAKALGLRPIR